jgi:hypothetical protein
MVPGVSGSRSMAAKTPRIRIMIFASRSITTALDANGLMIALSPTTKVMLMSVLPITLVNASSE